jgi:hypothetical protein
VDGKSLESHARAGACPEGRYAAAAASPTARKAEAARKGGGFGPGDAVAGVVKVATLGRVEMCATCRSRRKVLNAMGWRGVVRHPLRVLRLFTR